MFPTTSPSPSPTPRRRPRPATTATRHDRDLHRVRLLDDPFHVVLPPATRWQTGTSSGSRTWQPTPGSQPATPTTPTPTPSPTHAPPPASPPPSPSTSTTTSPCKASSPPASGYPSSRGSRSAPSATTSSSAPSTRPPAAMSTPSTAAVGRPMAAVRSGTPGPACMPSSAASSCAGVVVLVPQDSCGCPASGQPSGIGRWRDRSRTSGSGCAVSVQAVCARRASAAEQGAGEVAGLLEAVVVVVDTAVGDGSFEEEEEVFSDRRVIVGV